MNSYSQYGEDRKALEILEKWAHGSKRVLEIGAWHHEDKSNSKLFIDAGWGAVLVEPSPAGLHDLTAAYCDREDVVVVGSPVTVHGGFVRLVLSDDALSGEAIQEQWRATGGYYGGAWFNSLSVAELFAQFGGDFAVCSIDTEGTSVDVFAEMLNCGPRPRVVILEHDNRLVELAGIAEAAHYRQAHCNGTNVILEWTGAKE
jgi:hypothetical protein